jgi:hypothetical protein
MFRSDRNARHVFAIGLFDRVLRRSLVHGRYDRQGRFGQGTKQKINFALCFSGNTKPISFPTGRDATTHGTIECIVGQGDGFGANVAGAVPPPRLTSNAENISTLSLPQFKANPAGVAVALLWPCAMPMKKCAVMSQTIPSKRFEVVVFIFVLKQK